MVIRGPTEPAERVRRRRHAVRFVRGQAAVPTEEGGASGDVPEEEEEDVRSQPFDRVVNHL